MRTSTLPLARLLTVILVLLAAGGRSAAAVPSSEPSCRLMVEKNGGFEWLPLPGFYSSGPLSAYKVAGAAGVVCDRGSIVPLPTDYRVLTELNLPLFLKAHGVTLVLEIVKGQLQILVPTGSATPEETAALQARLNEMQTALQTRAAAP